MNEKGQANINLFIGVIISFFVFLVTILVLFPVFNALIGVSPAPTAEANVLWQMLPFIFFVVAFILVIRKFTNPESNQQGF